MNYLVLNSVKWKYWNDPCRENEILAYNVTKFDKWEGWTSHLIKNRMWTYLVLYSVKWNYWINPCRENEILAYMLTSLINGKVNLSLNLKHDLWTYLVLYLVKWKYWIDPRRENENLAYKVTKFDKCEGWTSPLIKTDVNLFGFEFGKVKVLEWPMSRKRDFSL